MEGLIVSVLGLVGIDQSAAGSCLNTEGGIARILAIECEGVDFDATTFDPAEFSITSLASTGAGFAAEYVPTDDETSNFDLVYDEATGAYSVTGFMKFDGLTEGKVKEANRLKDGCAFILVVEYNSCLVMVLGLDVVTACVTTGDLKKAKRRVKVMPSLFSGTGADKSRLELNVTGAQRCALLLDQNIETYDDVKTTFGL